MRLLSDHPLLVGVLAFVCGQLSMLVVLALCAGAARAARGVRDPARGPARDVMIDRGETAPPAIDYDAFEPLRLVRDEARNGARDEGREEREPWGRADDAGRRAAQRRGRRSMPELDGR